MNDSRNFSLTAEDWESLAEDFIETLSLEAKETYLKNINQGVPVDTALGRAAINEQLLKDIGEVSDYLKKTH